MHHTVFVADTPVGLPGKHPLFCLQRCLTTAALEATMAGAVRPVATVEGRRFEARILVAMPLVRPVSEADLV